MTTTTAYQTATVVPAASLSRQAERREDTRLRAELEIAREAAHAEQRRKDDQAWAEQRRTDREAKDARKAKARAERGMRNQVRREWLHEHTVDLLFVPVIVVPGALAWDAMAAYGTSTWGPLGLMLPLFSEGAMWAFDAAVAIRRRRDPDKPVWHLQIGIAIFACYGAALNFLHGIAPATPHHGLALAISMALVSVAGVVAHQLVIAGPRRSRAERELGRLRRAAERRQATARKAAVRQALIEIDEEGHANLVYEPGIYQLKRSLADPRIAATKDSRGLDPRRASRHRTRTESAGGTANPPAEAARTAAAQSAPVAAESASLPHVPAARLLTVREDSAARRGVPQPTFYGPATGRDDSGRDDEEDGAALLAGWPKEAVAERLATEIRAAADSGTVWKPDYDQLMALTGRSRRTCESIVSLARRLAGSPEKADGESSRSRPGIVPADSRTAAARPAGAA
jgi:hypothetical protein